MSLMIVFHGIVAAPVHGRVRILVHFIIESDKLYLYGYFTVEWLADRHRLWAITKSTNTTSSYSSKI